MAAGPLSGRSSSPNTHWAGRGDRIMAVLDAAYTQKLRWGMLALVGFGTVGVTAELLLIGHWEDSNQAIPLVVAAIGLVAVVLSAIAPGVGTLRLLQFAMLLFMGTGVIGVTLHAEANAEFQLESDPALSGMALAVKVLEATAPPALAPGLLIQLGLLGLLFTYKHPALAERERQGEPA